MDSQRLTLLEEMVNDPEVYQSIMESAVWMRRALVDADWQVPRIVYAQINLPLKNDSIRAEFESARRNACQPLHEPNGRVRECYANVKGAVAREGGKALFGWQIAPNGSDPELGVELEAHSIWQRPDGVLVDVTPGNDNWMFAESAAVRDGSKALMVGCREEMAPMVYSAQQMYKGMKLTVVWNSMRKDACRKV